MTAVLVAALTTGGPALGTAAFDAMNAHEMDGKHAVGATASADQRAGKLVATGASGFLPNGIIKKANNADKLDGVDSIAFARLPLFASVDSSGSAFLERGVDTSVRASTGVYNVLFDTPVDRCGHIATPIDGPDIVETIGPLRHRQATPDAVISRRAGRPAHPGYRSGPRSGLRLA
jgi:hypothetical protein